MPYSFGYLLLDTVKQQDRH